MKKIFTLTVVLAFISVSVFADPIPSATALQNTAPKLTAISNQYKELAKKIREKESAYNKANANYLKAEQALIEAKKQLDKSEADLSNAKSEAESFDTEAKQGLK